MMSRRRAFGHRRMRVVLVHHREVVIHVLLLGVHPPQAVLHDHRDLVAEGRIVRDAIGDRRRIDVRMAVLVLQAFAVQRGAPRGTAQQEAARAHVARRPREIADALEAEHRVEDVERDHRHAMRRIRRRRGDPVAHRARLVDALLQDLAVLALLVEHQLIGVLRRVELAQLVPDAELAEQALHAERPRFVGDDRHDVLADVLVAQQRVQDLDERHRRRDLAVLGALEEALERRELGHGERRGLARGASAGSRPARAACPPCTRNSGESLANVTYGTSSSASSATGMWNRSRKLRIESCDIFFCWCVMFCASPDTPMP